MFEKLKSLHAKIATRKITDLFSSATRFDDFSVSAADITIDYSKTNIDNDVRNLFFELLSVRKVEEKRDEMFTGKSINNTEARAVLHTALRAPSEIEVFEDNKNIVPNVHKALNTNHL